MEIKVCNIYHFPFILLITSLLCLVNTYPASEDESSELQQQKQLEADFLELSNSTSLLSSRREQQEKVHATVTDSCLEPRSVGKCDAYFPRYFFNSDSGVCEPFIWGGCGGNGNNFENLKKCESRCSGHLKRYSLGNQTHEVKTNEEICEQLPAIGKSCHAYLPRWTYNSTQGKCTQFIYKGCGATGNLFINKYKCEQKCGNYNKNQEIQKAAITGTQEQPIQDPVLIPFISSPSCDQPLDPGQCFGFNIRYYYNKQSFRCQSFVYGGCGGNENNFMNGQECMRNCGSEGKHLGNTPSSNLECSKVNCPWNLYTHYTSMDCEPIYDGDSCCPTRFDCSKRNSAPIPKKDTLTNESVSDSDLRCHYKGNFYSVGSEVPEASSESACRAACTCIGDGNEKARISCAMIECPEDLGALPPGKENCTKLYKKGSCCAYDFHCANETEVTQKLIVDEPTPPSYQCLYEGRDYVEGERIYSKNKNCHNCICQKGFNGTLTDEHCEPIDCGIEIYYSDSLQQGCAPVYYENSDGTFNCCPIGWECPSEVLPTIEPNIPALDLKTTTTIPQFLKIDRIVSENDCILPRETGPCRARRQRYFFNTTTQQCEQFTYGGCKGNKNNFVALRDCQRICENKLNPNVINNSNVEIETHSKSPLVRSGFIVPQSQAQTPAEILDNNALFELSEVDPCTQELRIGPCRSYFPRYYFSPDQNQCLPFIWGGCRGNRNNFFTKAACQAVCQNSISVEEENPIKPNADINITIISNQNEKKAEEDDNQGSQQGILPDLSHLEVIDITNSNTMNNKSRESENIAEQDVCSMPPETGRCKGFLRRFYYDPEAQYCKRFTYGGCGGNGNNFERLKECDTRCSPNQGKGLPGSSPGGILPKWRSTVTLLNQPQVPEKDQKPQYSFHVEKCNLPLRIGPCFASIPSFYYDVMTQSCLPFRYGGCFGNANRFRSLADCESTCMNTDNRSPKFVQTRTNINDNINRVNEAFEERGIPVPIPGIHRQAFEDYEDIPSGRSRGKPRESENICLLSPQKGNCRGRQLRYYWHNGMNQCLPFLYSGCQGNSNNFLTESDCLSRCGSQPPIEEITRKGILSCTFGNETIPVGGKLGGIGGMINGDEKQTRNSNSCGFPICQCITPPALTCIQSQCSIPVIEPKLPCPIPNCLPHCQPGTNPDNGCPTCDCEGNTKGLNNNGFFIELAVIDESQTTESEEKV